MDPRNGLLAIKSIPPEGEAKDTEWIWCSLCTLWAKLFVSTGSVASSIFRGYRHLFLFETSIEMTGALACPSALAGLK